MVTLSSRALRSAVTTAKIAIILKGLPFPILADLIATYSNTPVGLMRLIITIMEMSRNMTFQSTPNSSIWNASCCSSILSTSISPAPKIAIIVLCIFSETITTYEIRNMLVAVQNDVSMTNGCAAAVTSCVNSHLLNGPSSSGRGSDIIKYSYLIP